MTRAPATVVNISLTGPERDYDEVVPFLGREYRVVRIGASGRTDRALALLQDWSHRADAMAVTGVREARTTGILDREAGVLKDIIASTDALPVTNGHRLRDVLQEWTIRHLEGEEPGFFANARVVVLGGRNHYRTARVLAESTANIQFADPAMQFGLPSLLSSFTALDRFSAATGWVGAHLPRRPVSVLTAPGRRANRSRVRRAMADAHVVVASFDELAAFGDVDLDGTTVISSGIDEARLATLGQRGAYTVLDDVPQPFDVTVNAAVLEALMLVAAEADDSRLTDDDLLDMISSAQLQPRVLYPGGYKRRSRFAFVVHPLSQEQLRNVRPLDAVADHAPGLVMDSAEKAMAHIPPVVYSKIDGIVSPTGAEAEGWLIGVGGTPKELMSHDPEFTYKRLLAAAEMAQELGAQIMGLGAFTKVVGDAGVTVAKRAPLPITTGNSYSASGALWAAHDAARRLDLLEVDEEGHLKGKAMVVGATGSIGSVCARLLAMACDELWLVSIEPAKLLALKEDIERTDPRAAVFVSADADEHLPDMDVVVTATSGAGKRVLDIMRVKPGAVITDVARPLDLSPEDVAKRPDVLVIESGEIQLPSQTTMRDIGGLPPNVVYACLAETIVLALEGRFETFTVGRDIEWEKVREIYRLGLKHGMQLAAISGVGGVYSDEDVRRVRELALARRAELAATSS